MILNFYHIFDEKSLSKQNSPRWDAAFCGVTSGAILFAYVLQGGQTPGLLVKGVTPSSILLEHLSLLVNFYSNRACVPSYMLLSIIQYFKQTMLLYAMNTSFFTNSGDFRSLYSLRFT